MKWKWTIACEEDLLSTVFKFHLHEALAVLQLPEKPRYTTEEGTVLEGTTVVDMSKNLELGKDRKVEVRMLFGHTSIEVKALGTTKSIACCL